MLQNPTMTWGFKANMRHGCGCGKKKVQRPVASTTVSSTPSSAPSVVVAKSLQAATLRGAPTGPVVSRRTV